MIFFGGTTICCCFIGDEFWKAKAEIDGGGEQCNGQFPNQVEPPTSFSPSGRSCAAFSPFLLFYLEQEEKEPKLRLWKGAKLCHMLAIRPSASY